MAVFTLETTEVNRWATQLLRYVFYMAFKINNSYSHPLTPKNLYSGRTAPLTSKRCILYIYSTNIWTEYFKHAIYSPFFFPLQNAVCFIILTYLVPVLFTFYIQGMLKLKKNNSGAKRLNYVVMETQQRASTEARTEFLCAFSILRKSVYKIFHVCPSACMQRTNRPLMEGIS